jgi:CheY-like chemotaxis protein
MLKVLIIEDDEFKQRRIAQVVRGYRRDAEILLERSVNSGLAAIVNLRPDIILLDMSLTTFGIGPNESGGRPQNFGGLEILRQMDRLGVSIPVVVITQYERFVRESQEEVSLNTVRSELEMEHDRVFRGLVHYNSATAGWEKLLRNLITTVLKGSEPQRGRKDSTGRRRSP